MEFGQGGLSVLRRGGRAFGGLVLQGHLDVSSVRNSLKVHSMKIEWEKERLYSKESSSLKPLRQGRSSTSQLHQTRELLGSDQGGGGVE